MPKRIRDDRTSRAIIRDEALRLFAERGATGVTVREIAAAAGVSAALVVRHFGSKDGLREEVDRFVLRTFDAMLAELGAAGSSLYDAPPSGSLTEMILRSFPKGSPIPAYLRRLLLEPSAAGRKLFRKLLASGQRALDALVEAGAASPGADPRVRAAFLTANDLAVLLLREPLTDALGFDPLSGPGLSRWAGEVLDVYGAGLRGGRKKPRR